MWKKPLIKYKDSLFSNKFRTIVGFAWLSIGTIILILSFITKIPWLRAILLFIGSYIFIWSVLHIVRVSLISISDYYKKKIPSLISGIVTVIYIFLFSGSKTLRIIGIILVILKIINAGYEYAMNMLMSRTLQKIHEYYVNKTEYPLGGAFAFTLAASGAVERYSRRLTKGIFGSLIRTPSDYQCFIFIYSGDVKKYSVGFRHFLISRSGVIIILSKESSLCEYDESTIQEIFDHSLGKILIIIFSSLENVLIERAKEGGIVYFCKERPLPTDYFMKELSTRVVEELMPAFPLALADLKLSDEKHFTIRELARKGLQPLAGSYLRFRIAKSDVERLLCLLDCIEVLIKSSAISIIANHWQKEQALSSSDIISKLKTPSLGDWTGLLRDMLDNDAENELVKQISTFWTMPIRHEFHRQLITDVDGSGLSWKGEIPRSHIGWLDWFVWLRNVTRGHGVLGDKIASPIWESFHELFLAMAVGLKKLVFESLTISQDNNKNKSYLQGWDRKRYLRQENGGDREASKIYLQTEENDRSSSIMLYPLAVAYKNSILLWNRIKGECIEYIDYSSGQIVKFNLSETDPYIIWTLSR